MELLNYQNHAARENEETLQFFLKKDKARVYSQERGNLPMFSIDLNDDGGSKYFLVTGYNAICKHYINLPRPHARLLSANAHPNRVEPFMYEVIMDEVPLDLYLDIEGSRETNPDINLDLLYEKLMSELKMFLSQMSIAPESIIANATTVVLDSSTNKKFSKHVIMRLDSHLFANNYICGALMRNFHLHILSRWTFENNPFYIAPDAAAKSNVKIFFLDVSVYTKNRDFRLLGSCKRKGCAQANPIRWMWLENKPNVITKELFLGSLIQRRAKPLAVTCYITRIVDTINGGIPLSSSLKTAQPLGATRKYTKREPTPQQQTRVTMIADKVAQWIRTNSSFVNYFRASDSTYSTVKITEWEGEYTLKVNFPDIKYCRARLIKTGTAFHKSNSIFFSVNLSTGEIRQMCASNTCVSDGKRDFAYILTKLPKHFIDQFDEILDCKKKPQSEECLFPVDDD